MQKRQQIPETEILSEESRHLYDVLNKESDLACVLIAGSYLDYALASLLKRYLIESDVVNKMLEPSRGVLSTFASRYDLAYSLGLIPKGLYRNLEVIGRIRNAFAHSYRLTGLDNSEIGTLIDSLIPPIIHETIRIDGDERIRSGPSPFVLDGSPRDRFSTLVIFMVNEILMTSLSIKRIERKIAGWD